MDNREVTDQARMEAKRENVELPYRLVMIRQKEYEKADRYKEANECAAIRRCLEIAAESFWIDS
jgi:hypothetical protein